RLSRGANGQGRAAPLSHHDGRTPPAHRRHPGAAVASARGGRGGPRFVPKSDSSPVVPAKAGTHIPETVVMGPRVRGDDRRIACYLLKSRITRSMPLTTRARLSASTLSGVSLGRW